MGYTTLPLPAAWGDLIFGVIKETENGTAALTPSGASQPVTYTLKIPAYEALTDFKVADTLSVGWEYVAGSTEITYPNGVVQAGAASDPTITGNTLVWETPDINPAQLAPNDLITIQYTVTTTVDVQAGPNANEASVCAEIDLDGDGNTDDINGSGGVDAGDRICANDITFVDVGSTVGDRVWYDLNENGFYDAGEPGIAGVTVTLTSGDDPAVIGVGGSVVATTDADGRYKFVGLGDDTDTTYNYTIELTGGAPPSGELTNDPDYDGEKIVSLSSDSHGVADFGYKLLSISGQVRGDLDNDADPSDADAGLSGAQVNLYWDNGTTAGVIDANDTLILQTTTGIDGKYSFTAADSAEIQSSRTYLIQEVNPTSYQSTYDTDGSLTDDLIQVTLGAVSSADNDFLDYAEPGIVIPDIAKTVSSTSDPLTGTDQGSSTTVTDLWSDGSTGETVTFDMTITVPEGDAAESLVVTDTLPYDSSDNHLEYVSYSVVSVGSNLYTDTAATTSLTTGTATVTPTNNPSASDTVEFDFGTVRNVSTDGLVSADD